MSSDSDESTSIVIDKLFQNNLISENYEVIGDDTLLRCIKCEKLIKHNLKSSNLLKHLKSHSQLNKNNSRKNSNPLIEKVIKKYPTLCVDQDFFELCKNFKFDSSLTTMYEEKLKQVLNQLESASSLTICLTRFEINCKKYIKVDAAFLTDQFKPKYLNLGTVCVSNSFSTTMTIEKLMCIINNFNITNKVKCYQVESKLEHDWLKNRLNVSVTFVNSINVICNRYDKLFFKEINKKAFDAVLLNVKKWINCEGAIRYVENVSKNFEFSKLKNLVFDENWENKLEIFNIYKEYCEVIISGLKLHNVIYQQVDIGQLENHFEFFNLVKQVIDEFRNDEFNSSKIIFSLNKLKHSIVQEELKASFGELIDIFSQTPQLKWSILLDPRFSRETKSTFFSNFEIMVNECSLLTPSSTSESSSVMENHLFSALYEEYSDSLSSFLLQSSVNKATNVFEFWKSKVSQFQQIFKENAILVNELKKPKINSYLAESSKVENQLDKLIFIQENENI